MTYDAAIFDLDGTLVDTESLMFEAGVIAFDRQGLTLTEGLFASVLGTDGPTGNRILSEALPGVDLAGLTAAWDAEIHRAFAAGIPAKSGAADLLAQVQQAGVPVAVATSSGRKAAAHKLASSGLARFFEVVVTADDVTQRKPAPDPYLLAARRLGVDPARCIAFEDSAPGTRSALAAGMTVVLVPDMAQITGVDPHHEADSLLQGAQMAGLLPASA